MTHTKGPWEVEIHSSTGNFSIQREGFGFATVFANRSQDPLADAHLIAAAPDLAAFVGKVIKWKPGDGIAALQQEARSLYEAAIAKARP